MADSTSDLTLLDRYSVDNLQTQRDQVDTKLEPGQPMIAPA